MFGKRKNPTPPSPRDGRIPVIRCSICTGEQVAGFKDPASGKFQEVMLLRNDKDLAVFLRQYQLQESEVKREW